MNILYVDDAPFTRMLLKRCLEGSGHQTRAATCGKEALAMLAEERPDLLITDLLMEGMSGTELMRQIREQDGDLPILVLTADVQDSTKTACKDLGALAVFPKGSLYPNGDGLVSLIRELFPE